MSVTTTLYFYTEKLSHNLADTALQLLSACGVSQADEVLCTYESHDSGEVQELSYSNYLLSIAALQNILDGCVKFTVFADSSEACLQLEAIQQELFTVEIHGDLKLDRFYFSLGNGELINLDDDEDVAYEGLVAFWGYSTPNNGPAFEKSLLENEALKHLHSSLEKIMGKLKILLVFG